MYKLSPSVSDSQISRASVSLSTQQASFHCLNSCGKNYLGFWISFLGGSQAGFLISWWQPGWLSHFLVAARLAFSFLACFYKVHAFVLYCACSNRRCCLVHVRYVSSMNRRVLGNIEMTNDTRVPDIYIHTNIIRGV